MLYLIGLGEIKDNQTMIDKENSNWFLYKETPIYCEVRRIRDNKLEQYICYCTYKHFKYKDVVELYYNNEKVKVFQMEKSPFRLYLYQYDYDRRIEYLSELRRNEVVKFNYLLELEQEKMHTKEIYNKGSTTKRSQEKNIENITKKSSMYNQDENRRSTDRRFVSR